MLTEKVKTAKVVERRGVNKTVPNSRIKALCLLCLLFFVGCGQKTTFEKVDRHGHVLIRKGESAYCFDVPQDWEIRENVEGADVVCLAPREGSFRDSVVATSLGSKDLEDPKTVFDKQLAELGSSVTVEEPWRAVDVPVVVTLTDSKLSAVPLGQMLYIHKRPEGDGVLLVCTTTKEKLPEHRETFAKMIAKAKYSLEDCPKAGGIPETFPTPEVTYSPAP